jgi:hypothetical protein
MTDTLGRDDQTHTATAEHDTENPSSPERIIKWSEQWWAEIANPTARRCTATSNRTGQRCQRAAMDGQRVCGTHGGRAPQAKRKAQQRIAEAADRMARELLKMATDEATPEHVKLKAITEALDRAGVNAKTSVEVEVSAKPFEQVLDGFADQLEITSRAAFRQAQGIEDDTDDETDPLADLAAHDQAQARAQARRDDVTGVRDRSIRFIHDDDVIDAETLDVIDIGQAMPPAANERQRHDRTAYDPTRLGGSVDQPVTVVEGNEIAAELRARAVERDRSAGHAEGRAAVRPAQRALPPGRSR